MDAQEAKRHYRGYRYAARKLYQDVGRVDSRYIVIEEEASVHRCSDGAYVHAVIWIPKGELTHDVMQQVLRFEEERKAH